MKAHRVRSDLLRTRGGCGIWQRERHDARNGAAHSRRRKCRRRITQNGLRHWDRLRLRRLWNHGSANRHVLDLLDDRAPVLCRRYGPRRRCWRRRSNGSGSGLGTGNDDPSWAAPGPAAKGNYQECKTGECKNVKERVVAGRRRKWVSGDRGRGGGAAGAAAGSGAGALGGAGGGGGRRRGGRRGRRGHIHRDALVRDALEPLRTRLVN
ncbi:hypothetical protein BC828DRAFT_299863 [Blastocladiella britannica]|nr:hypothetical protein BC828DRAFT_299863 [Blastocladiella britannica]